MTSIKPTILQNPGPLRKTVLNKPNDHVVKQMEGHAVADESNRYRERVMESTRHQPTVEYKPMSYQEFIRRDDFEDITPPAPTTEPSAPAGGSVRPDPFSRPPVGMERQRPERVPSEPAFRDDASFERVQQEAAVLADDSPLGRLTPFKPGYTRSRLFSELPKSPESEAPQAPSQAVPFKEAFKTAREAGEAEFGWEGKQYTTELAEEEPKGRDPFRRPDEVQRHSGPIIAGDFDLDTFHEKLVGAESGGDVTAKNPLSSATGRYQFIESTWLGVGQKHFPDIMKGKSRGQQLELRKDAGTSRQFFDALTSDNRSYLESKGVPINDETMYMAHFAGAHLASQISQASDTEPLSSWMSGEAMKVNRFPADMTVGSFKQWIKETIERK